VCEIRLGQLHVRKQTWRNVLQGEDLVRDCVFTADSVNVAKCINRIDVTQHKETRRRAFIFIYIYIYITEMF